MHRDRTPTPAVQPRSAPQVLAICISETAPSCMRAPPEQANSTTGSFRLEAPVSAHSGDRLADDHAHRAAEELEVHHADRARDALARRGAGDDRVGLAGLLLRRRSFSP
jgi:hypothetical protein